MIVLAIETSAQVASVSVSIDGKLVSSLYLDDKLTHSQTLMPLIDKALSMANIEVTDINSIVVSKGPGSFTGLRIGMSVAKGLADGLGIEVLGISTLKALANNIYTDELVCPIMDARRGEVYTAAYYLHRKEELIKPTAISIDSLIKLLPNNEPIVFVGDGVLVYRKFIQECLPMAKFAPFHLLKQNSSTLAFLATDKNVENAEIEYLRRPQAERELLEKVN